MKLACLLAVVPVLLIAGLATGAEHRVEVLEEAAPKDSVPPSIAALLSPTGLKVIRGTKRSVCDLWLCKELPGQADFTPSGTVLYPFESGELIGVVRYGRKGGDFRGQDIAASVYTIRYAQQPVDGNHVGTSDTLDFLLLLPIEEDKNVEPLDPETMVELSTQASGTTHPAMLCLLTPNDAVESLPHAQHDEEHDLWSIQFEVNLSTSGKTSKLPVRIVVAGQSAE